VPVTTNTSIPLASQKTGKPQWREINSRCAQCTQIEFKLSIKDRSKPKITGFVPSNPHTCTGCALIGSNVEELSLSCYKPRLNKIRISLCVVADRISFTMSEKMVGFSGPAVFLCFLFFNKIEVIMRASKVSHIVMSSRHKEIKW
jgi:hypothetical protein